MLRSLYISLVYGIFLCAGFVAPFALGLGYVWVDNFSPQRVAYSILTEIPVSEVMAVAAVLAYLLNDRRSPPRMNMISFLSIMMLGWITYTTFYEAVSPESAYWKWNWAAKTVVFSLFMPALFRSRTQIEAFLQIYIFSIGGQVLPFAAKTLIGGGGYGASFGVVAGNAGLSEGSTLSTACMVAGVLSLYLSAHQTILPQWRIVRWGFIGMFLACVTAAIGTFERTALVGIAVVVAGLVLQSKRRLLLGAIAGFAGIMLAFYLATAGSDWAQRMATIVNPQEGSSLGRLLVWQWTLDFVRSHPLGGGFYAYIIDKIVVAPSQAFPEGLTIHGKAFHSIYFEMLGENGFPGLLLFLGLFAASFRALWRTSRMARQFQDLEWCSALCRAVMLCLAIIMVCGAFISMAFQPEVYYVFALAVMLQQYMRRVVLAHEEAVAARQERADQKLLNVDQAGAWEGYLA